MSTTKKDILVKVALMGGAKVGKSSLANCHIKTPDPKTYKPTIGVDFTLKVIETERNIFRFQLWDISSSERHGSLIGTYQRGAEALLYVYSEDPNERESSLQTINAWEKRSTLERDEVITVRVGNKLDLANKTQSALAADPRYDFDVQVSALNKQDFEKVLGTLASRLEAKYAAIPKHDDPNLEAYKQAINKFVQTKNPTVQKFKLFSEIRDRANRASDIDEIRQHVKDLKKEASHHRDTGLKYALKFCWCRKPKSRKDLDKIFDRSHQLKMKR